MSAALITAIVIGVIAIVSGGALIVGLSEPLASVKDLFMALVDLICDNAIWFAVVLLIFIVAFSLISKAKIAPLNLSSNKQQKIDNKYRQQKFKADQRQLEIDNKYREQKFEADKKQQKINNKYRKQVFDKKNKQDFMQHSFTKKQLNDLFDDIDNIKLY